MQPEALIQKVRKALNEVDYRAMKWGGEDGYDAARIITDGARNDLRLLENMLKEETDGGRTADADAGRDDRDVAGD